MTINHLRLFVSVLLIALVTGCRQGNPELRVEKKSADAVKTLDNGGPEVIKEISPNTVIVGGVPATTSSDEKTEDVATAEDKTGAVAVKTQY